VAHAISSALETVRVRGPARHDSRQEWPPKAIQHIRCGTE
jgi:hypothetical protein